MGMYNARNIKKQRKQSKMARTEYRAKLGLTKSTDPLEGSPQAKGIVLDKRNIEAKQPNSALRKCVRVQLIKNGKQLTAFCPGEKARDYIDEHDEVTVEGVGGAQSGPKGDIPTVRYQVSKVNGVSLKGLRTGEKQKPTR